MKLGWWAGHDEELGVAKRRWMEKKKMYFELMQVIHPDCGLIYIVISFQNYFEVQLRWSNKVKSLSTFCGKFSLDIIQKQQCHCKAYIGWTKAICLRQCKVNAFHCFSVRGSEGGARVEWMVEWRVKKVAENWYKNDAYLLRSLLDPLLGLLPLPFHFSATFSLLSPSRPFHISISASAQHLHSCSEDKVPADKGVKRSEQAWKAERVKWSWGDGQGHNEGLVGGV